MKKRRIGLDIDGVVANFAQAIIDAGHAQGISGLPEHWHDFTEIYGPRGGKRSEQHQAFIRVWEKVRDDQDFWDAVPVHEEDAIVPHCYITARPAGVDSYLWLFMNDLPGAPLITVVGSKVEAAKKAGVTLFLDDAPHNLEELRAAGIECWLLDRPWNRHHETPFRVKTIAEILDK